MAVGVYGTNRLATVNTNDVDIYYHYRPTRNSVDPSYGERFRKHPNSSEFLVPSRYVKTGEPVGDILYGMYMLNLPLTIFNKKGIYTILLTPKQSFAKITDSPATLSAMPEIRGVVIDSTKVQNLTPAQMDNGQLVGWRIDYYSDSGEKLNYFRIISSNNFVEPVADNLSNTSMKSISYRYNDNSNLIFCTVTPSSAPSVKASALPYIGTTDQQIAIVNTNFNSQVIEVELIESDADTLSTLIMGSQALNLDKGLLTTYTEDGQILSQVEIIQVKSAYTDKPTYTLRVAKSGIIDRSETFQNVMPGNI